MINRAFVQTITGLSILLSVSWFSPARAEVSSPRQYRPLTTDWKFYKGDIAGAEKLTFDDSLWRTVTVPHDWSIEGPYSDKWASGTGYLPGGIGWYRYRFTLDAADAGKRVFAEFDGVYRDSEVWINDQSLGKRPYGYSSFYYDLTPYLRFGGDANILAVRVDHSDYADSRWYTGSGIYRPVRLCITEPIRVEPWGVFVTTPNVDADACQVHIETTIDNASASDADIQLSSYIVDADGLAVATVKSSGIVVQADGQNTFEQQATLKQPRLWSVDKPVLYSVLTVVEAEGRRIDMVHTPFGIRSFRFDPDKGFSLNGQNMKIKGVCVHHDAGPVGAAVPTDMWRRRLEQLKTLGCNAIRMSHNPPAPDLLDLCDEMGFLVMDEAFDEFTPPKRKWVEGWNVGTPSLDGYGEVFTEWAVRDIQDMVRRDRNHPSIIFWSIGNEIDYANDPFSHPVLGNEYKAANPPAEALVRYGKPLVEAVKALDTTRPVTSALANVPMSDAVGYSDLLDAAGYNYQESRYAESHARYPKRVIYGSENGKTYDAWRAVVENDYIAGQFLWVGYDFLGEARTWPVRSSQSGLFDLCGFKKPIGWFRQALWAEAPMVYAAVRSRRGIDEGNLRGLDRGLRTHWNWPDGQTVSVVIYSNCPEVDVVLNGEELGPARPLPSLGPVFVREVAYAAGQLKVVGKRDGKAVCEDVLNTAGEPKKILLKPDRKTLKANGQDVCHVEFYVTDENGAAVQDADSLVRFFVTGAARVLAVGNGDPTNHEDETDATHNAWQGQGLAVIQALHESGRVTVSASAPGLESMEITLNIE